MEDLHKMVHIADISLYEVKQSGCGPYWSDYVFKIITPDTCCYADYQEFFTCIIPAYT